MTEPYTVSALLDGKPPVVCAIYARLVSRLREMGSLIEDPKKTSIHLKAARSGSAFAGVQPRKSGLLLTIRSEQALDGPTVRRVEQASRNRFHNELLLTAPSAVNSEVVRWLTAARALSTTN